MFRAMLYKLEKLIDEYDLKHYKSEPCTNNVLCQRVSVRHCKDCPGRVNGNLWSSVNSRDVH